METEKTTSKRRKLLQAVVKAMSEVKKDNDQKSFEQLGDERQASIFEEFTSFILENKAWWLVPILIVFALVGALLLLTSTGAAPFIYTLF